jgi:SAM-dependent methyltransferase
MELHDQATVADNIRWFQGNGTYEERLAGLECSRNTRRIVEWEISGVGQLLDVGNGGFFNYDTSLVGHVTAVDLFVPEGLPPAPNVEFKAGSLLDLPLPDSSFDCVLQQYVLHHVTGRSVRENHDNLAACFREMHRCVRPGGKVVVIESTVGPLFYLFEALAFRPALFLKRGGHPVTFQFTPGQIIRAAERCGLRVLEFTFIPRGAFLLQFGYKWPSLLTPARPIKLVLGK